MLSKNWRENFAPLKFSIRQYYGNYWWEKEASRWLHKRSFTVALVFIMDKKPKSYETDFSGALNYCCVSWITNLRSKVCSVLHEPVESLSKSGKFFHVFVIKHKARHQRNEADHTAHA